MIDFGGADSFTYKMSILKSSDPDGTACSRYFFEYPALTGVGHFIHTYVTDGSPIPTFLGEPERISIPSDIDEFTEDIWNNLNQDNKVSLYVRYYDMVTDTVENRLINQHELED